MDLGDREKYFNFLAQQIITNRFDCIVEGKKTEQQGIVGQTILFYSIAKMFS